MDLFPVFALTWSDLPMTDSAATWQNFLGAALLFVVQKFFLPKFPALSWILDILTPKTPVTPSDPAKPVDPSAPVVVPKDHPLRDLIIKILQQFANKQNTQAAKDALAEVSKSLEGK